MLSKFEAEAKRLRPRSKGPEAEARGYEAEAKMLASRPVGLETLIFLSLHFSFSTLNNNNTPIYKATDALASEALTTPTTEINSGVMNRS